MLKRPVSMALSFMEPMDTFSMSLSEINLINELINMEAAFKIDADLY